MPKFLSGVMLFLLSSSGMAQESWGLEQLMQDMARVETSSANFTETKTLSVLTAPLTLSGKLFYRRPGRVEKHVLSPYDESLRVEGDALTLEKNGKSRV
ncbi:MAG: LolA family protein, partial [Burkholderiales bacterium]